MTSLVIAHKISKPAGSTEKPLIFRRTSLNDSTAEPVQELVKKARKAVQRSSAFGKFDRATDGQPLVFERIIRKFLKTESEDDFIELSVNSVDFLAKEMQKKQASTGGFVVFAFYENETGPDAGARYLVVALITDQNIPSFDAQLNVIDSTVLDLDHLKHGVRVKISSLESNSDGVVSLLSNRSADKTAGYFREFIGSTQFTDSADTARRLDERLREWGDSQKMDSEEFDEIRYKVYRHWKEQGGADSRLSITALSNSLYPEGNPDFESFMTDEETGIPADMPAIKSRDMGRFRRLRYSGKGLTLAYDTGGENSWSKNVRIEGEKVIIDNVPAELIKLVDSHG